MCQCTNHSVTGGIIQRKSPCYCHSRVIPSPLLWVVTIVTVWSCEEKFLLLLSQMKQFSYRLQHHFHSWVFQYLKNCKNFFSLFHWNIFFGKDWVWVAGAKKKEKELYINLKPDLSNQEFIKSIDLLIVCETPTN